MKRKLLFSFIAVILTLSAVIPADRVKADAVANEAGMTISTISGTSFAITSDGILWGCA